MKPRRSISGRILLPALVLCVIPCGQADELPGADAYAGRAACSDCHPRESALYQGSQHDLAMQTADATAVRGDFSPARFRYNGVVSTFFRRAGGYFVNTDDAAGQLRDFEIKYTFGVYPLQQYLVDYPGGRLQALSIAWDTRALEQGGQHWFHLYPEAAVDYRDELHWTGRNQNWNYMCAECHSTGLRKGYDAASDTYHTTWEELDVSCEACHGPGARHAALARSLPADEFSRLPGRGLSGTVAAAQTEWRFRDGQPIASPAAMVDNNPRIRICARCHSRRLTLDPRASWRRPLADGYQVSLLEPDLYFPDGQIEGEVYVYGSFIQSRMYRAGVSCGDCHDPHSLRLRAAGDDLCLRCHRRETYAVPAHHFHAADSAAARCVACHMPGRYYMVNDLRRDHSFRLPRPDLSISLGTPNACNGCHTDRSPDWARQQLREWYGRDSYPFHYGTAIQAGRTGQADAETQLVRVIGDASQPAIARATALELMADYLSPLSQPAVSQALHDGDPMVRGAAVRALASLDIGRRYQQAAALLRDPVLSVRINAAQSLARVPLDQLPGEARTGLQQAVSDFIGAQRENGDRAFAQVNLGNLYRDQARPREAEDAYRRALKLEPEFLPAAVNLADLYRQMNREDESLEVLNTALAAHPDAPAVHHALGLALVRQRRYGDALGHLQRAAELAPDNARFSLVYAIALNSQQQPEQALAVLRAAYEHRPGEREILMTLALLYRDQGKRDAAGYYARKLQELAPWDERVPRLLEELGN